MITQEEQDLINRVLDVADPASDCAIGNDEIERAREIIDRETQADKCCFNCQRPLYVCREPQDRACQAYGALYRLWMSLHAAQDALTRQNAMTEAETVLEVAGSVEPK